MERQNSLVNQVDKSIKLVGSSKDMVEHFRSRLNQGSITRDENPVSHICVYFAAYDSFIGAKKVFLGLHKKSQLWLFNGGHVDSSDKLLSESLKREIGEEWGTLPDAVPLVPSLFTITQIDNPDKQRCRTHYDLWYLIGLSSSADNGFKFDEDKLSTEFSIWEWMSIEEARKKVTDPATLEVLSVINAGFEYKRASSKDKGK